MHIIWKRPDGFQSAQPSDFYKVPLSNGAQLWLHNREKDWYPFQVSGDWEGQNETQRLNRLVNMLGNDQKEWKSFLEKFHDDDLTQVGDVRSAVGALTVWIEKLKSSIKGHTWELEIIACALTDIQAKLKAANS